MNKYEQQKDIAIQYTTALVLPADNQWLAIPWTIKLSMLQITPDKVVKKRKVWNTTVPYVSIDYIERALNFVSNFQRGIRIVDKWIKQYTKTTNAWKELQVFDAWVQCDCYIVLGGNRIDRSCFGAWQMYENPAISDYSVYESAKSMATKSFADTLGIGSDKIWVENQAIEKARDALLKESYSDNDVLEWFDQNG